MKRYFMPKQGFFIIALFFSSIHLLAQNAGGNATYNFLTLPYSAKASSLGGMNISSMGKDLGLAMFNPALLDSSMDGNLHLSIRPYYANIQQYDFSGAHYWTKKKWVIGWGVHYMDYGTIKMTDVAGNEMGNFRPNDYMAQVSLSTYYIRNVQLGTSLKWIQSNYGIYKSNAMAIDVALRYTSTNELNQASILLTNLGGQIKTYTNKEDLPFNLIAGWSIKLEKAPIQFSVTAQRLSVWNNSYYDVNFANQEGYKAPGSMQNLFNHLIVGAEVYMGSQVDLNFGYNFIRRFDLNVQNQQNWFNGFSAGLGIKLPRTKIQYGNAFFQRNLYHHFSVFYSLKNK
jgi:hypothetical protein